MDQKRVKSNLLLFLAAFIWGTAFVAQKVGGELGTFSYNGTRTLLGGLILIPVILVSDRKNRLKGRKSIQSSISDRRTILTGGICCGVLLFAASSLQQYGIQYTTVGKAGFITSLYAVLVPVLAIFLGRKVRPVLWLCIGIAMVGLYLLTMTPGEGFSLQKGDMFVLFSAVAFAFQIMAVDHFVAGADPIKLACVQFLAAGGIGVLCMFLFESPQPAAFFKYLPALIYGGVFSTGIAYTLQMVGQKNADPSEVSLILCLESVISALSGALLLHETMSARSILGCVMIFSGVVISQLPEKKKPDISHKN